MQTVPRADREKARQLYNTVQVVPNTTNLLAVHEQTTKAVGPAVDVASPTTSASTISILFMKQRSLEIG